MACDARLLGVQAISPYRAIIKPPLEVVVMIYYINGLGGYSGKYAIDKTVHTVNGGSYTISVEAHAVELEKDMKIGETAAENTNERRKLSNSGKKVFLRPV